jgi:hypothetical protein
MTWPLAGLRIAHLRCLLPISFASLSCQLVRSGPQYQSYDVACTVENPTMSAILSYCCIILYHKLPIRTMDCLGYCSPELTNGTIWLMHAFGLTVQNSSVNHVPPRLNCVNRRAQLVDRVYRRYKY